jgi:hypothetical protein
MPSVSALNNNSLIMLLWDVKIAIPHAIYARTKPFARAVYNKIWCSKKESASAQRANIYLPMASPAHVHIILYNQNAQRPVKPA